MSLFVDRSISNIVDEINNGIICRKDIYSEVFARSQVGERFHVWADFQKDSLLDDYKENEIFSSNHSNLIINAIPVGIKDIFNTEKYTTEMGSVIWKGFHAGNDARVVYNIKRHGGVVAGKTVTAEFAVHALNETLNPYDIERTPGTSSSGSAVAVALGIVPVALATQTAGSIIRPSSFCGVFGYIPSFGLVPRTGVLKTTDSLDTIGFITSRIDNIKTFLNAISVKGPDYPFIYKASLDESRRKNNNRKWKVCFLKTYIWDDAKEYVKQAIEGFVNVLGCDKNVEIHEGNVDDIIFGAHDVHNIIYDKSLSYYFENEHHDSSHVSEIMNSMIEHGQTISSKEFFDALDRQDTMYKRMDEWMLNYDVIISISTSSVAPLRGAIEARDPSLIWTLLHLPSISVPAFFEKESGLPFGIQFSGRRFNDDLLIEFIEYLANRNLIPSTITDPDKLLECHH